MTRTSFCPRCQAEGRPKTGDLFVVWGESRKTLLVYEAHRNGRTGFTPHTFEFKRLVDKTVYYDVACSMVGCGSIANPDPKDKKHWCVGFIWDNRKLPINDWNALVKKMKRDPLFEI